MRYLRSATSRVAGLGLLLSALGPLPCPRRGPARPCPERHGREPERRRVPGRGADARRRGHGHRRRRRDGVRSGGHASQRGEPRRRRLSPVPGRHRRGRGLRLSREGSRGRLSDDVPAQREVRREPSTTAATCRSAFQAPWRVFTWPGRPTERCPGVASWSRPSLWPAMASSSPTPSPGSSRTSSPT